MVRIRYSFLVKIAALFFFALFIIPSLLKLFNGSSQPSSFDENGDSEMGMGIRPRKPRVGEDKPNVGIDDQKIPSRIGLVIKFIYFFLLSRKKN